ncbi:hypothetical protein ACIQ7D_37340 [Streptomyces sp. NPDC096310]|uniref:hypothetical protein n=1 Tax=Streptomyces sp. NPDC096310 TaxID=3366082 RepID=UPI00380B88AD
MADQAPLDTRAAELAASVDARFFHRLLPDEVPRIYAEPTRALLVAVLAELERLGHDAD